MKQDVCGGWGEIGAQGEEHEESAEACCRGGCSLGTRGPNIICGAVAPAHPSTLPMDTVSMIMGASGQGSSPVLGVPLPWPPHPAPRWTFPPVAPASPLLASALCPTFASCLQSTGTPGQPAAALLLGYQAAGSWLAVHRRGDSSWVMEVRWLD